MIDAKGPREVVEYLNFAAFEKHRGGKFAPVAPVPEASRRSQTGFIHQRSLGVVGGFEHRRRDPEDLAVEPLVVDRVEVGERRLHQAGERRAWVSKVRSSGSHQRSLAAL